MLYQPPLHPTLAPHVLAGLDPAIGYPHQIANDTIPVSNHPMEMAGSSAATTWLGLRITPAAQRIDSPTPSWPGLTRPSATRTKLRTMQPKSATISIEM